MQQLSGAARRAQGDGEGSPGKGGTDDLVALAEAPSTAQTDSESQHLPELDVGSRLQRLHLLNDWIRSHEESRTRRAFIVEFGGMPKAGKSMAIANLRHVFSHGPRIPKLQQTRAMPKDGYLIHTPAEGVSLRTPTYFKENKIHYNAWAGAYALQELLEAAHDEHHHMVVLDRGPWDAGCWLELARSKLDQKKHSSPDEKSASLSQMIGFYQCTSWMIQADLHIVLVVSPEEAYQREAKQRLIAPSGPSADRALMSTMYDIYKTRFEKFLRPAKKESCPHVGLKSSLLLDTSNLSRHQICLSVVDVVLDVLELKLHYRTSLSGTEVLTALTSGHGLPPSFRSDARHLTDDWAERQVKKGQSQILRIRNRLEAYAPVAEFGDNRIPQANLIAALQTCLTELEKP